jgi:Ca-activated chloride channel family protein
VLLDVSISMKAQDVLPNRLEQAKQAVRTLVEHLQKTGGHRLGLVAFAGRASLQSPMTMDYPFFLKRLEQVDTETLARDGTSIGSAIRQVLEGFSKIEYEFTDLIILTDGEDHNSFPLDAARLAGAQKMNLYTVGIGDASEGHLVPVKWTEEGLPFFAKYRGQAVLSQMNQSLLLEMARVTNGKYLAGGTREVPLDRLYLEAIADKPRRNIEVSEREHLIDRYHWFVLAAILLLAADMLLRERKVPMEGQV